MNGLPGAPLGWSLRQRSLFAGSLVIGLGLGLPACTRDGPAGGAGGADLAAGPPIKLDHFGYRPGDPKVTVFSRDPGKEVQVRSPSGDVVSRVPMASGSISRRGRDLASGDEVWWVDLGRLEAPGRYRLWSPRLRAGSYEFQVAPGVYRDVMRAALRTFYLQRCGVAKTPRHAGAWADAVPCHRTDTSTGPAAGQQDRGLRDLSGGWHDAGDYNKYLWYAASNAIRALLDAWEQNPRAFPDGDLNIPESHNGVSDLLDEVKWELDFFLRMQLADGAALSSVHASNEASGRSPPSADTTRRYYFDPTPESTAVLAGSCALASRVFAAAGHAAYASTLRDAALLAWRWLQDKKDGPEKVWAAAEVFRMDPSLASARSYVDDYHTGRWSDAALEAARYDTHAAVTYLQAEGATPAVASAMRASLGRQVDAIFASDDLYRNGMPVGSYHWGSNAIRAAYGVLLLDAARLGATGSHTVLECRLHALEFLHFFHGQNPLSMLYLTNMSALGGEHSSWQIFHNWFGQSRDPYSRSRYVGKPASVVEPDYPYFRGSDNHGVRDDKASALGPPPGFVPGGPNRSYAGDSSPPLGALYPNRCYRDWNDQAIWTARTWEITENSIGYQGPYVRLVSAFVEP